MYTESMSKNVNGRTSEYEINDIFLKRFSPRAMSGEAVAKDELMTLFEAARWAPSASNLQPWKFIYAFAGTEGFENMFSTLVDFNKDWAKNAGALIVVTSKKTRDSGKEHITHSFDAGAAWENFALQGAEMGLVVHGMAGFDYDMAKVKLGIPEDYAIQMMIAVGKPGKVEDLPEAMRAGEKPNDRKPLSEIAFENKFPA